MEPQAHVRLAKQHTVLIGGTNREMQRQCSLTGIRNLHQKNTQGLSGASVRQVEKASTEPLHVNSFQDPIAQELFQTKFY